MNSYKMISRALLGQRSNVVNLWKLREWLEKQSDETKETLDKLRSFVIVDISNNVLIVVYGENEQAEKLAELINLPISDWIVSYDGSPKATYQLDDKIKLELELELPDDMVIEKVKQPKCMSSSQDTKYVIKTVGQLLSEGEDS